jgi:hypothetical protein
MNYEKMWEELKDEILQQVEQYGTNKDTLSAMMEIEMMEIEKSNKMSIKPHEYRFVRLENGHEYHFVRLENGEWEGFYLGNKLVAENHRLSADDVLKHVDDALVLYMREEDFEKINLRMPEDFAELTEVL